MLPPEAQELLEPTVAKMLAQGMDADEIADFLEAQVRAAGRR
jgi:hypothetical protein